MLISLLGRSKRSGKCSRVVLGSLVLLSLQIGAMALFPRMGLWLPVAHAASAPLNPIQIENSLPGDPNWDNFAANLNQQMLSGYASQTSIDKGSLSISTSPLPSRAFRFRSIAWAGIRVMAHVLWRLWAPSPVFSSRHAQSARNDRHGQLHQLVQDGDAQLYLAPGLPVSISPSWMASTDNSFIIFVVRDDGGHEPLVFQTSVDTY